LFFFFIVAGAGGGMVAGGGRKMVVGIVVRDEPGQTLEEGVAFHHIGSCGFVCVWWV
jgi:hypothetical protein